MEFLHTSVLPDETLELLEVQPDGIYVDGTLGGGGHAAQIAARLTCGGRLIGIDQDQNALAAAKKRLAAYSNITFVHSNFCEIDAVLEQCGVERIHGALLDLGVSSHQLDEPSRGFSYRFDAPLDMRMNQKRSFSAYDVVNGYSAAELERIFREYGEERYARRIAERIVRERQDQPLDTTFRLAEVVKAALGRHAFAEDQHPARRTFQAIRIEVNEELDVLEKALEAFFDRLEIGGRLLILTFHSLEDRMVKQAFRGFTTACTCPPDFPVCVCGGKATGRLLNKKPLTASEQEKQANPRAACAKLRGIEKIENRE